jgi:4-amino-4-deoxy-L-arabinose transferase-like glycosyltransferase
MVPETMGAPDSPSERQPAPRPGYRAAVVALLCAGAAAWLALNHGELGLWRRGRIVWSWQPAWLMLLAVACLLPGVAEAVSRALERVRCPSDNARRWITLAIVLAAGAYLGFTARQQHRELFPKIHDEGMYVLQARMLAEGHLWLPAHPLADFFETFHVIVRPVYASIYFPGTALLYAMGHWLHLPPWVMALFVSACAVGMLYRVTTELTDGVSGLLAALLLVSLTRFRHLSILVMSHTLMLLLGLLMVWAYLHWRKDRKCSWALALGALAGWAAITRPLDALCFALPIGVAMLVDLRGKPLRSVLASAACLVLAAAPFISMQLVMNRGVTGHALQTPASFYDLQYWPHLFTWSSANTDPSVRPPTSLQQIQDYYDQFMLKPVRDRAGQTLAQTIFGQRVPMILGQTLPSLLLVILFPVGLLALRDRRRLAFWTVLPLFVVAYTSFIFFQKHYTLIAAPAVILTVLLGARILREALGTGHDFWEVFPALAIAVLAVWALPQIGGVKDDEPHPTLRDVNQKLARIPDAPAVVLFRYRSGDNFREEPVYNLERAWPDDARIIRAHDLGAQRNAEIFNYYARLQPGRIFYLYDRQGQTLTRIGAAAELAKASNSPK